MSDRAVELFQRFVDETRAGAGSDPAAYIAQAGDQGEALSAMLAAYLAAQPAAEVDEREVLALADRPELSPPRPWSQLLPELRERRGTTRSALVKRLAELLGVRGAEEQVAGYVHRLETGQHAPRLVRPAVVEALARALDAPRDLLEASRRLPPAETASASSAPVFARSADVPTAAVMSMLSDEAGHDARVDDLFSGGPDG